MKQPIAILNIILLIILVVVVSMAVIGKKRPAPTDNTGVIMNQDNMDMPNDTMMMQGAEGNSAQ